MGGADVWEIVAALRDSDLRGDEAVTAIAVDFDMSAARVQTALSYYGAYADEIDAQIAENERAADDALKAWQSRQRLFA